MAFHELKNPARTQFLENQSFELLFQQLLNSVKLKMFPSRICRMNLRQQPGVQVLACLVDPKMVLELLLILAFQLEFTLAMRVTFPLFGISQFALIPSIPLVF